MDIDTVRSTAPPEPNPGRTSTSVADDGLLWIVESLQPVGR